MNELPDFEKNGNLPAGIHWTDLRHFIDRFGVNAQRLYLLNGLKKLINNLRIAGCSTIFIDGSFTSTKEAPNDYDACWEMAGVNPNILDPILLDFTPTGRSLQKTIYKGDIFPAQQTEKTRGVAFLNFFQIDKQTGDAKGIVAIKI